MPAAAGTLGPSVARFFEGNLRLPEGERQGEPFVLEDWQREDTDIIYETDAAGRFLWKVVVYGLPRGSGKSPLTAGYANHALVNGSGSPQIWCAAAAKKQAGIVHMHASKEAQDGPLEDFLEFPRVREALGPIKCPHNDGILRVVSADGDLQQGLNPYFVSVDELHTFRTGKQVGLFSAFLTAMHKRLDSRMLVITTAGASKDSLLGELVDAIIEAGEMEISRHGCKIVVRDYEAQRLLIWYGAPENADIRDPKVWRACNPASWISDAALLWAAHNNPESEFRRYYLNQWVKGEDAAIQPAVWDACRGPEKIPAGSDIWVGVDIGEKRDTSAVDWIAETMRGGELALIVRASVFTAKRISGMETTLPRVEAHLRWLRDNFNLRGVYFDKWQMRDMAIRLADEGFPMVEFSQRNESMVPASQLTFDLIANRRLIHSGDKVLRAHVLGTGGEITATGGWRFTKAKTKTGSRDQRKQNDACIALAMAAGGWRSDQHTGGDPWSDTW
jgi:phage terminase large subunit-like protein